MRFSVIIPTFNRRNSLMRVLSSLEAQTFPKDDFEVVIVDDGSIDDTQKAVADFAGRSALTVEYFYQSNSGQSQARNLGIEKSQGDIILFCGDDTIFDEKTIANHEAVYLKNEGASAAVLGLALWDESIGVNDFMHFIAPAGPQFHYHTIKDKNNAGWDHFYTCNISIPRRLLGDQRFDGGFRYESFEGFEDIDLGLRLARRGVKIIFNNEAVVYHAHSYEPAAFYQRMLGVGRSFKLLTDKYKGHRQSYWRLKLKYAPFDLLPGQLKFFNFLCRLLSRSSLLKINQKYHWFFNVCYYYSAGLIKQKRVLKT